ncbi:NAD(P)-binding protein [Aspergillus crustosus]
MPSYLITGASRGIGYQFVRQLAADSNNIAIGLVRNKAAAEEKAKSQGLINAYFVEAQYTDLTSLKIAAEEVKKITGGSLNYLVNNAANVSDVTELRTLGDFHDNFTKLEDDIRDQFEINVLGVIKTIEAFVPLLQAVPSGEPKKVLTITSGMADLDLINKAEVEFAGPYAISKGALNVAIAKYNALYKREGILFFGVCPGPVRTERQSKEFTDPKDLENLASMGAKFVAAAPDATGGQITPEESVTALLALVHRATIEEFGGAYVSRHGTRQFI